MDLVDAAWSQALAPVLRDPDQVQKWAIEASWQAGQSASWPECPEHPASHPLSARVDDDRAVWTCPATGQLICAVGRWPGPGSLGAG